MASRPKEPRPNPQSHLSRDELDRRVLKSHQYSGALRRIVHRKEDGSRQSVERCTLDEDRGVIGDRWELSEQRKKGEQISVMSFYVAEAMANGQSLELFGDNLFIDADLRIDLLPIGYRFRLGKTILEVSKEPHDGCSKFAARFGKEALKLTACKENKNLRLRGVYLFVVEGGQVCIGDVLQQI